MNVFGGDWTQKKLEIVEDYAKAYLTIMNRYPYLRPLYFDGFAGSGDIVQTHEDEAFEVVAGAARRILSISEPKPFEGYYFVEKCPKCLGQLQKLVKSEFAGKDVFVLEGDCNQKLVDFAGYMARPENSYCRGLVYIDPYGMQLEWSSIAPLKGRGIDLWILVPTGVGVNRMLTQDGTIDEAWATRLQLFLGLPYEEIRRHFYVPKPQTSLFDDNEIEKVENAIQVAGDLYSKQLQTIFKHVSKPFILKNSKNSPMYHFVLATDNDAGLKIANDVIRKRM